MEKSPLFFCINTLVLNPILIQGHDLSKHRCRGEKKAAKQKRLKFLNDIIENEEKYKEVMSNFENNKSGNILFLRKNGILINEENEDEEIH